MTRYDAVQATSRPSRTAGYIVTNMTVAMATVRRAPRVRAEWLAPTWRRAAIYLVAGAIAIVASMLWIDTAAIAAVAKLPAWVVWLFREITRFGESGWFLVPLGVLLIAVTLIDGPWLQRWSRLVFAALAVRIGFLFIAIALPGLLNAILKRLIGRARPSQLGPFFYDPLTFRAAFEGLPSGHATTAFSVLVAFGAIFPQLRWLLWLYALLIAASRVVVQAHYPSDVLAGAALGAFTALCVRDWFARRRLGFSVSPEGQVHPFPGPSRARLKGVARRLFAS